MADENLRVSNDHLLNNDYQYYWLADSQDERLRLAAEIREESDREDRKGGEVR